MQLLEEFIIAARVHNKYPCEATMRRKNDLRRKCDHHIIDTVCKLRLSVKGDIIMTLMQYYESRDATMFRLLVLYSHCY